MRFVRTFMSRGPHLSLIISIVSCGGWSPGWPPAPEQSQPLPPLYLTPRTPLTDYQLADPECQKQVQGDLGTLFFDQFTLDGLSAAHRPVSTDADVEHFSTTYIDSLLWDRHVQRSCDGQRSLGPCVGRSADHPPWQALRQPRKLRLCSPTDDTQRYPIGSLEHIAANVAAMVEVAGDFATSLHSLTTTPIKIHLDILPLYESLYHLADDQDQGHPRILRRYLSDNMAYTRSTRTLSVLPRSRPSSQNQLNSPQANQNGDWQLWQSAFVVIHEYGHHIETQITQVLFDPPLHQQVDSFFLQAISEAFADLFAYFAEDPQHRSHHAIPMLGTNRDPSHNHFDWTTHPKAFSAEIITELRRGRRPTIGTHELGAHDLGAVIASTLFRLFEAIDEDPKDQVELSRLRASRSISWLRAYFTALATESSPALGKPEMLVEIFARSLEQQILDWITDASDKSPIEERICRIWQDELAELKAMDDLCQYGN